MKTFNDIEYINRYLDETLPNSERELLEQRLNTDTTFRQTFVDVKEAILAVQVDNVWAIMHEEQAKLDTKVVPMSHSKPFILRGWFAAAASVALLAVAGFWLTRKTPDAPFRFIPKPNNWAEVDRGGDGPQKKEIILARFGNVEGGKLLKGLSLYENEKYAEAAAVLLSIDAQNDTLSIYQSNALIKANKEIQAISILEKIAPNSPTSMERDWYLALAYQKMGNIAKAKSILTAISLNPNHDWQAQAEKLLLKRQNTPK